MREINLGLDVERRSTKDAPRQVARVCVLLASGYVKGGGAPTITADCESYEEFEREVARLKGELDVILEEARPRLVSAPEPASGGAEPEEPDVARTRAPESSRRLEISGELRVSDLMTRDVKTLRKNDKLSAADELMKLGGFRHVVVVDEEGDVEGVVSHRNIFYGALAWAMGQGRVAHQKALESFPVKEVMESNVVTIGPEAPLKQAAEAMIQRKIGCLPVVEDDHLVGILTEGDFLAMLAGSQDPSQGG